MVLRSDMPLAESELTAGEDLSDASELVDLAPSPAGVGSGAVTVGVSSIAGVSATGARNE